MHCRRYHRVSAGWQIVAIWLGCLMFPLAIADTKGVMSPALTPDQHQFLWLEVLLNGYAVRGIVAVQLHNNQLSLSVEDWQTMGLKLQPEALDNNGRVQLSALPQVVANYQVETQRLLLTLPSDYFKHQNVMLSNSSASLPDETPLNVVLNYDVFVQHAKPSLSSGKSTEFAGFMEGRLAGQWGSFNQSIISQIPSNSGQALIRRLDTNYQYLDPVSLTSWQLGDGISRGLLSRPAIRFGGLQWQRNFSLRPDLITFPTVSVSGSSAVPTAVDVFVDQVRRSQMELPAGPFTLNQLPVLTGPHQVQVVVRDALGREQISNLSVFASPFLLSPGLLDFAVQAGVARQSFAQENDRYSKDPLAIGSLRYGLNDRLTLEGQAEVAQEFMLLSSGVAGLLANNGSYGLALANSIFQGRRGHELNARFDYYLRQNWVINGSITESTHEFRDISVIESESLPVRSRQQLAMSKAFDGGQTLAASVLRQQTAEDEVFSTLILTAASSVVDKGQLSLSAWHSLSGDNNWGISLGLSWFIGARRSVSVQQEVTAKGSSTLFSAQSNVPQTLGWGWRVDIADGQREFRRAELLNRNHYSDVSVLVENGQSGNIARAGMVGALAWMPGTINVGRRINDAFALVDVGYPDVGITLENRSVGRTNTKGFLLVNDLNAYQRNKLSIQALDLPLDVSVGDAQQYVTPARASGVRVNFNLTRHRDALLALRHTDGQWLSLGSLLLVPGDEARVVGHDGQVVVPVASAGQRVMLQSELANCHAQLPAQLLLSHQGVTVVEVQCQ